MDIFKHLLNQFRNHKSSISFLLIGFIVSSTIVSFWTSNTKTMENLALEKTEGIPENTLKVTLINKNKFTIEEVGEIINNVSKESSISFNKENIPTESGKVYNLSLEYFKDIPIWRYPLVEGRDFSVEEASSNSKVVLIGKKIINECYKEGNQLNINLQGEKFKVVGIVGRNNKESVWDSDIFMPFLSVPSFTKRKIEDRGIVNFLMKNTTNVPIDDSKRLKLLVEGKGYTYGAEKLNVQSDIIAKYFLDKSNINSLTLSVLGIAIINIICISIYWINDRKEEISIRKAFGIENRNIIVLLAEELFFLCLISSMIVILIQWIISYFSSLEGVYLDIYIQNVFSAVSLSAIVTLITLIIPIYYVIREEPIELLKN